MSKEPIVASNGEAAGPSHEAMLEFPFRRPSGSPLVPPPEYAAVRASRADVVRVNVWSGDCPYLATRYSSTREAFAAADLLSSDPRTPGYVDRNPAFAETISRDRNFRTMVGDEHTAHRALVAEDFSRRRLNLMRPMIEAEASALVDDMARGQSAEIMSDLAFPLAIATLADLIGVPSERRGYFSSRVAACISGTNRELAAESGAQLLAYADDLLSLKLAHPGDDLASRLASKVASGVVSREEATSTVRMLLIGGFETTANTIGLGTLALLTHDEQRQLLLDHLDDAACVANAVNEILRYAPVLQLGAPRAAVGTGRIGNVDIATGDAVICSAAAANFDPEVFPDPEQLDLERKNAARHLSFGFGKHSCVAQNLARIEIAAALTAFFARLPHARLAVPMSSLAMKSVYDQTFGIVALPVAW